MAMLVVSWWAIDSQSVAYAILLLATACLGAGFGLVVVFILYLMVFKPTP